MVKTLVTHSKVARWKKLLILLFCVFNIQFLPNYRVKHYYYYTVNWDDGVACNWCIFLDIVLILAFTYLSILVDGFRVQSRGDHGWPPLACGILSSSSDIEGCRAVVSGIIWIRLLDSTRLM